IQNASSDIEKEYIKNAVSSQKTKHKREFYRRKVEEMKNLTMAMAKILAVD
uniref:Uncharacterized protein n=1 Tax=Acrobeloides nanus TaxID=290746 RepID=A0A914D9G7_9BILA